MTRKQYVRKLTALTIAIHNAPESNFKDGSKHLGNALRYVKAKAKTVPATWGSYDAAWNSDAMKWARKHYGVN